MTRTFDRGRRAVIAIAALAAIVSALTAPSATAQAPSSGPSPSASTSVGRWLPAASPNVSLQYHTATLLPDGKVLVVGDGTSQRYDPAINTWIPTTYPNAAHFCGTATLLRDGRVLVASRNASELYDPVANTWTATGRMSIARFCPTATLLLDGRVLVVGGEPPAPTTFPAVWFTEDTAEVYDPATGTWTSAGRMSEHRSGHTATLLSNGKVLVVGGMRAVMDDFTIAGAEIYDPAAGTWTAAGSSTARQVHSAIALPSGEVMVIGGLDGVSISVTDVFDPRTGVWKILEPLHIARGFATATLLGNGRVLVAGGMDADFHLPAESCCTDVATAELYDVGTGRWLAAGNLQTARHGHSATLLQDGRVLVVGGATGFSGGTPLASAELYEPAVIPFAAGYTGSWYSPAQSGHGFVLEVLPGDPMRLLAGWFTFAPQGGPSWIVGVGPISGDRAVLQGYQAVGSGGRFPPNFNAAAVRQESWGTLTFTFSDCNHGRVEWISTAPDYGSGGMDLTRLTLPAGLTC